MRRRLLAPGLAAWLLALPALHGAEERLELKADVALTALGIDTTVDVDIPALPEEIQELVVDEIARDPFAGLEPAAESTGPKLTAEEEKALREFIKKASEARRKQLRKAMLKTTRDLAEEGKLDAGGKKRLNDLADQSLGAAMTTWETKFQEWCLPLLHQAGSVAATLKQWQPEGIATHNQISGEISPEETEVWKKGLKEILSPELVAAREAKEKAKLEKFRKEMGDYLANCEAQAQPMIAQAMDARLQWFLQHDEIDEERRKQLQQAAESAIKLTTEDWKQRSEKQLLAMDESNREQMAKSGGHMGVNMGDKANQPYEQTLWKEATAKILGELREVLEARREEARGRRAEALAILLIGDLDRFVGLGEKQREGLLGLTAKLMLNLPAHYFASAEQGYYSLETSEMFRQFSGLKEEQLNALLDEGQRKRWKAIKPEQLSRHEYRQERIQVGDIPPAEEMDEIEVERIVSSFLHRESRSTKQKMQALLEAQVENIARVAQPAPEALALLRTAAKGAAEEMAQNTVNNLSSWARSQFQNLKPADVPARLKNLHNPYFGERQGQQEPRLWTASVERALNETQRAAWKAERVAWEAWQSRGMTAMVVSELEKRMPLRQPQREALDKKLGEVIREYEADFNNYFSPGWHLQGYYSMIPLAMLTDKEMEELFGKKQAETVKEKFLGQSAQYVEQLRTQHKNRVGKKGS